MSWFAWVLIAYFWLNMLDAIRLNGKSFEVTPVMVAWYLCVTGFMTWAAVTQIG